MKTTKADKYFSLFIRIRDTHNGLAKCCTCGVYKHPKYMTTVHFNKAIRYNEMNCHAQCKNCEGSTADRTEQYRKYMIERYGKNVTETLESFTNDVTYSKVDEALIAEKYHTKSKLMIEIKQIKLL